MKNNFSEYLGKNNDDEESTVYEVSNLDGYSDFYKENKGDEVWWIEKLDCYGEHLFSFDKKKIYNLFSDYPYKLTAKEKEIFDRENPFWKDFFRDRV